MIPLLLILASFLLLPLPAGAACSPKRCGDLNVAYPFWLEEKGQPPCGSPSFQLNCNGGQAFLTRSIYGLSQVVRVFAKNSSFVVVDHNLLVPLPAGCPAQWFNISNSIGLGPFTISRINREVLVLFNCTKQQAPPQGFLRAPCHNESFFNLAVAGEYGSHLEGSLLPPSCHLSVVPVLGFMNGSDYDAIIRQGYLLEWTVASEDCSKCLASGGRCAYGNDGTGFSCNCFGAMYPEKCGDGEFSN